MPVSRTLRDWTWTTRETSPDGDAVLVSRALRDGQARLPILDNVASGAAGDEMLKSGHVPRGACRVLITTRDGAIEPAGEIPVGWLEAREAREAYRLLCERRRKQEPDPPALPADEIAEGITEWLGGLAVAVAAVAAHMKLKPPIAWEASRRRRAVEHAALLPPDMAPTARLEWLLEADAGRSGGPLKRTLDHDPDDTLSPPRMVLRRLAELDVLLPAGEGGKLLGLHNPRRIRVNERNGAPVVAGLALLDSVAQLADHKVMGRPGSSVGEELARRGRTAAAATAGIVIRGVVPSLPSPPASIMGRENAVVRAARRRGA